ncbi:hypothetical protein VB776_14950 [Arcicella sp. DC2W]|uniref:Uncharacterized protein n=1 Tax=Arcicella gelida TaxID=2984195 RepID=A0ABU5S6X8_9BACT|nr:hypothetical protein [Arcicella sp. DC2W]MEA5404227.1 hypothetical protein [Arcicella sp. DC2W]
MRKKVLYWCFSEKLSENLFLVFQNICTLKWLGLVHQSMKKLCHSKSFKHYDRQKKKSVAGNMK